MLGATLGVLALGITNAAHAAGSEAPLPDAGPTSSLAESRLDPARLGVTIRFDTPPPSREEVAWTSSTSSAGFEAGEQLPGGLGATETVEYYGYDATGSVRMVFDTAGNVVGQGTYTPFGQETYDAKGLPSRRFTGQERDIEMGFDYFNARLYQSRTGRFATVDPEWGDAGANPQRWNRYSYVLNNPLSFSDPTGRNVQNCGQVTVEIFGFAFDYVFCYDSTTVSGGSSAGDANWTPAVPRASNNDTQSFSGHVTFVNITGKNTSNNSTSNNNAQPPKDPGSGPGTGPGTGPKKEDDDEGPNCTKQTRVTEVVFEVSFMGTGGTASLGLWEQSRPSFFSFPRGGLMFGLNGGMSAPDPHRPVASYSWGVNYSRASLTPTEYGKASLQASFGAPALKKWGLGGISIGGIGAQSKVVGWSAGMGPASEGLFTSRFIGDQWTLASWGSCK